MGDFPDMKIQHEFDGAGNVTEGTVSFTSIPTMVTCRKAISKVGHLYFCFLPPEGCQCLKNYLERRMKMRVLKRKDKHGKEIGEVRAPGEKLEAESPLIAAIKKQTVLPHNDDERLLRHQTGDSRCRVYLEALRPQKVF